MGVYTIAQIQVQAECKERSCAGCLRHLPMTGVLILRGNGTPTIALTYLRSFFYELKITRTVTAEPSLAMRTVTALSAMKSAASRTPQNSQCRARQRSLHTGLHILNEKVTLFTYGRRISSSGSLAQNCQHMPKDPP